MKTLLTIFFVIAFINTAHAFSLNEISLSNGSEVDMYGCGTHRFNCAGGYYFYRYEEIDGKKVRVDYIPTKEEMAEADEKLLREWKKRAALEDMVERQKVKGFFGWMKYYFWN